MYNPPWLCPQSPTDPAGSGAQKSWEDSGHEEVRRDQVDGDQHLWTSSIRRTAVRRAPERTGRDRTRRHASGVAGRRWGEGG